MLRFVVIRGRGTCACVIELMNQPYVRILRDTVFYALAKAWISSSPSCIFYISFMLCLFIVQILAMLYNLSCKNETVFKGVHSVSTALPNVR